MEDLLVLLIEILRFLLLCVVEWGVVWLFVFVLFFHKVSVVGLELTL